MSDVINERDYEILKNFATINQSIKFKTDGVVSTLSPSKVLLGTAKLGFAPEMAACVYDLQRFLSCVKFLGNPTITFGETYITLSSGGNKVMKYQYVEEKLIITPPASQIEMRGDSVTFVLTKNNIEDIFKAKSILGTPEILIKGSDRGIELRTFDRKTPKNEGFILNINDNEPVTDFDMIMKGENFKMMPGDYTVTVNENKIGKFEADGLMYQVAFDSESTFNGE